MPITKEARAEINRRNAQKSTGPKTETGKAVSRTNALKHGLTATTLAPIDAPGEPPGAYQARLDAWIEDTQPRNVLELTMIQRACRASWKLDRCARFEDAAAARREEQNSTTSDTTRSSRHLEAHQLGTLLMFALHNDDGSNESANPSAPSLFDDAPGHVDQLGTFKEGIEWMLWAWAEILPGLPLVDGSQPAGSDEFLRRCRLRALRLLGVPSGASAPSQPLREAARAEMARLEASLTTLSAHSAARRDADLALFGGGAEGTILIRYESQAERELHRAVGTFLALRKNPELLPSSDLPPARAAKPEPEPEPRPEPRPEPKDEPKRLPARRLPPVPSLPLPNEPSAGVSLNPSAAPKARRTHRKERGRAST